MQLHGELYNDLPPAEQIREMHCSETREMRNAEGYYSLVQDIAEKYGEKAYTLAEEVFKKNGMYYSPEKLRMPGTIRNVSYTCIGANIYALEIRECTPEMVRRLKAIYNCEMRKIAKDALIDESFFTETASGPQALKYPGEILVAFNGHNIPLGFVHCASKADGYSHDSVEALFFAEGRLHTHVGTALAEAAVNYFKQRGAADIGVFKGCVPYPFYEKVDGGLLQQFKEKLNHIYRCLEAF